MPLNETVVSVEFLNLEVSGVEFIASAEWCLFNSEIARKECLYGSKL